MSDAVHISALNCHEIESIQIMLHISACIKKYDGETTEIKDRDRDQRRMTIPKKTNIKT